MESRLATIPDLPAVPDLANLVPSAVDIPGHDKLGLSGGTPHGS